MIMNGCKSLKLFQICVLSLTIFISGCSDNNPLNNFYWHVVESFSDQDSRVDDEEYYSESNDDYHNDEGEVSSDVQSEPEINKAPSYPTRCDQPTKTIFSCQTAYGKQLDLCESEDSIHYIFGKTDETPELIIDAKKEQVQIMGFVKGGFSMEIPNSNTTYTVYYTSGGDPDLPLQAGIQVSMNGRHLADVYCTEDSIFSQIESGNLPLEKTFLKVQEQQTSQIPDFPNLFTAIEPFTLGDSITKLSSIGNQYIQTRNSEGFFRINNAKTEVEYNVQCADGANRCKTYKLIYSAGSGDERVLLGIVEKSYIWLGEGVDQNVVDSAVSTFLADSENLFGSSVYTISNPDYVYTPDSKEISHEIRYVNGSNCPVTLIQGVYNGTRFAGEDALEKIINGCSSTERFYSYYTYKNDFFSGQAIVVGRELYSVSLIRNHLQFILDEEKRAMQ